MGTGKSGEEAGAVLTLSEVARELKISEWLAGELARRGEIPSLKLGRRRVFPRGAIRRLLDAARAEGAAE